MTLFNELSVRKQPFGGGVSSHVRTVGSIPNRHRRIVVFIHGYATSEKKARKSYVQMVDYLRYRANVPPQRTRHIFGFFWPGDLRTFGLSWASYPYQLRHANASAIELARYLREQAVGGFPREVVLVAHSLGSRVALATARELRTTSGGSIIVKSILMAAAVPVWECVTGQVFQHEPILGQPPEVVIHSRRDRVLKWGFPLGQTFRADQIPRHLLPQAVGRAGSPAGRWSESHPTSYGHGDYWKGEVSAGHVARAFGMTRSQLLDQRELVVWDPPDERLLDERDLDYRLLACL